MAIPELAGFHGKHIYLDADMIVRGDIAELLTLQSSRPFLCLSNARTDVSVIDASMLKGVDWWPSLPVIKRKGWKMYHWVQRMLEHGAIDPSLPDSWNVCDPWHPGPADPGVEHAKLLHFTTVPTQPYQPYPTVKYSPHPFPSWVAEWNKYEQAARTAR